MENWISLKSEYYDREEINNTISNLSKFRNLEKKDTNVLFIDDLYGEGKTLTEMTKLIKTDPNIKKVFVLTITKKRT